MHILIGGFGAGLIGFFALEPFAVKAPQAATALAKGRGPRTDDPERLDPRLLGTGRRKTLALLTLWASVQLLVPLRHYVIPGSVHWTEEGHRYSWYMLLRQKYGTVFFEVTDPSVGHSWRVNPLSTLRLISWKRCPSART
jgi:hypothetical protein